MLELVDAEHDFPLELYASAVPLPPPPYSDTRRSPPPFVEDYRGRQRSGNSLKTIIVDDKGSFPFKLTSFLSYIGAQILFRLFLAQTLGAASTKL